MNEQILIFSQIVLIDLVLAVDTAIIIGMVASQFPLDQRKKISLEKDHFKRKHSLEMIGKRS